MNIQPKKEIGKKQKRWIIGIAIVLILWVIGAVLPDRKEKDSPITIIDVENGKAQPKPRDILREIDNALVDLKSFGSVKANNLTELAILVGTFKIYWDTYKMASHSTDKELLNKASNLKTALISAQQRVLPKLRKKYVELLSEKLWEENIYISALGAGNTTISIVGSNFANNKSIKAMEEAINDNITYLRFKQTQYRWYKGQEDYQYFTYTTAKDSEPY